MADNIFAGSVPRIYDAYFVPLLFDYYAVDLAGARLCDRTLTAMDNDRSGP